MGADPATRRTGDRKLETALADLALLKHDPTGVELEVSMAWTDFEHEALAACSVTDFGAARAPMAQADDLIVFKAIAGRAKDIQDATTLLVLYPAIDRARIRRRVSQQRAATSAASTMLTRATNTATTASLPCAST